MPEETQKVPVVQITETERVEIEDVVVNEFPLTIVLNDQELVTMLCSPTNLKYLAFGFLASEGLIGGKKDIKNVLVNERQGIIRLEAESAAAAKADVIFKRFITSGCGKGTSFYSAADMASQPKVESQTTITVRQVFALMKEFQQHSEVYRATHGVHSAALCDAEKIIVFTDDMGRHNAIDKIFGQCLWEEIPTDDKIVFTTGRISSEVLLKIARRSVPMIVSKSAPSDMAIRTALDMGITLVGKVRGRKMLVYSNSWRIVADEQD